MKRHIQDHSCIVAKFKCLDCNFISSRETEMEVHIGKEHTDRFEWCSCGCIEDSSETQLLTCKVFHCGECDERTKLWKVSKSIWKKKYLEINKLFNLKFSTENYMDIKKKGYYYKDVQNI